MWAVLVLAVAAVGITWWRTRPVAEEDATVEAVKQVEKQAEKAPAEAGIAQAMTELSQDPASVQATAEAEAPEPVWEAPVAAIIPIPVPVLAPTLAVALAPVDTKVAEAEQEAVALRQMLAEKEGATPTIEATPTVSYPEAVTSVGVFYPGGTQQMTYDKLREQYRIVVAAGAKKPGYVYSGYEDFWVDPASKK